ncbi:MAG: MATE family efflux transporter [Treponema sp.]|nr:MATE family efflux transporter [Treponema sp.]
MTKDKILLSDKEAKRREFMLNGNTLQVLITIAAPLVFYNMLHQAFQFIDTWIAADIGSDVIGAVSFIQQLHTMLMATGQALAVGGGIIIARYYGAGDLENVSKYISTIFFTGCLIAFLILIIFIPGAEAFLRLMNMPEDLLDIGVIYFMVEITSLVAIFINTIYLSTEKSRGNTKKIMYYNILVVVAKTFFTIFFVYFCKKDIIMLALATLLSHSILTFIAIYNLTSKHNIFRVSVKNISFRWKTLKPVINLSLPIFFEKFVFNFGKAIVNSMAANYGSLTVGALGVSNRLGGLATTPPMGVQEAESTLISQNDGAKNTKRALDFFKNTILINGILAVFFLVVMMIFKDFLIGLFAKGNQEFANIITSIYQYEIYGSVFLAAGTTVHGFLYGFGYTKLAMILNILRLFAFRLPVLWIIQNFTNLGFEGVGWMMLISNALFGISTIIAAFFVYNKIKSKIKN